MTTEIWERVLYIFGGFLVGGMVVMLFNWEMIHRSWKKNWYLRGVKDVLEDHVYCDKENHWHQLSLTWRDLSK